MPEKLDFITPTLMKILELFLEDPVQEYHEREVIRKTGVSKGSANHILRMLAESDFLIRKKRGRMVFYSLDMKEPAVRQFKVLVNIYALKKLLERMKEHCRRVILFGSCAQGTDVKESDVDLFILTAKKTDKEYYRRFQQRQ
jgi:predicted nucleotidyltransferase